MKARKILGEKAVLIIAILLTVVVQTYAIPIDVNIYNSTIIDSGEYGTVNIYDTPPDQTIVDMTGGSIFSCYTFDTTVLNYDGGDIYDIWVYNYSTAYVETANCSAFEIYDYGQIHMANGPIGASIQIFDNAQLHIYGYNLYYDEMPFPDWITGQWENGQSFKLILRNINGYNPNQVFLHEIPEPCSGLILASLVFLDRFRRKKTFK